MTQDTRKLGPTLTMARLYESQQQFLDALAIYRRLHSDRGDAEAAAKIAELEEKILSEKTLAYDAVISRIFNREELKRFRILPRERFAAWREANRDSDAEPVEEPAHEDEETAAAAPPLTMEEEPVAEPASVQEPVTRPAAMDLTLGQVMEALGRLGDPDTRLGDIPLGELLAALCRGGN